MKAITNMTSWLLIIALIIQMVKSDINDNSVEECNLSNDLRKEIASYAPIVQKIITTTTSGRFQNATYNHLAQFVDKFGSRFTGTENLENSIDYMLDLLNSYQLDNVHGEEVEIPHWERGNESATLFGPRLANIPIVGLGYSVGTPTEGIFAEVLVVKSFDELKTKAGLAKGKIIVFNEDYISYGTSVEYRGYGAIAAAKVGGVASLIRSVTPFSMETPHTGMQHYNENVTKIPTACITIEDAQMLQRLQDRGDKIKILLKMDAKNLPPKQSRNTIAELKGKSKPEQTVIVSGHLDSWDVGVGAMDDGGGAFISWMSLVVLKSLGLQPKRTIRAILWTGEEMGLVGALAYQKTHLNESDNFNFIMESDIGTFNPLGIEYSAGTQGGCILEEIMSLLAPINATQAKKSSDVGSDITIWMEKGFPGASLLNDNEKYFWFHHSAADRMEVENPAELDRSTALWASVAYVIADLSIDFPKEPRNN